MKSSSTSYSGMPGLARILLALVLFGVSFGYVEAAVVIYLRALYEPMQQQLFPGHSAGEIFPLIRMDQLETARPEAMRWLVIELARELGTLLMLAAVALALAHNFRQWLAAFLIAFGLWDIFFYAFLKALLDWPSSLFTWDLLFLLPVPWAGPVLAPLLVALSMVGAGVVVLLRESGGQPIRPSRLHWIAIFGGGVLVVLAFCWDYRNLLAGGEPSAFNWPLFGLGEGVGLAAFLHGLGGRRNRLPEPLEVEAKRLQIGPLAP